MKAEGIRSKLKRKYRVTTDSKHTYPIAENLLQRDFSADGLSQKWVGDITYIRTNEGWLYLTVVIYLADRKVIGWSFSENLTAKSTTIAALKMAVKNRKVNPGLIFHSDRGVQYACNEFKALTERYGHATLIWRFFYALNVVRNPVARLVLGRSTDINEEQKIETIKGS